MKARKFAQRSLEAAFNLKNFYFWHLVYDMAENTRTWLYLKGRDKFQYWVSCELVWEVWMLCIKCSSMDGSHLIPFLLVFECVCDIWAPTYWGENEQILELLKAHFQSRQLAMTLGVFTFPWKIHPISVLYLIWFCKIKCKLKSYAEE